MADDATHHADADPAGPVPHVPKPAREPIVIEGEARELAEPVEAKAEGEALASDGTANSAEPRPEAGPVEGEPVMPAREASAAEPRVEQAHSAPAPTKSEPAARAGGAFGTMLWGLVGAIVGVVLALGAAWLLDPRAGTTQALTSRLDAIAAADETRDAATQKRQKTLEGRLSSIEEAQSGLLKSGALDALDKRLAKLESGAIKPEALAALQAEVRAAAAAAAKASALAGAPKNADSSAPTLAPVVPEPPAPDPRVAQLVAAQAGLQDRIAKLESMLAAPKTETRVAPVDVPKAGGAVALAIGAVALEQRLRAGEPYVAELAALTRAGAEATALAALKPFAQTGAPSAAALAASFAKLSPGILSAAHPEPEGGVFDKLLDRMRKMVRVRSVGESVGADAEALVSQIEAALARGQIAPALAAFEKLPEAARKSAADWGKLASARAGVDTAARNLRDGAMAKLDAGKN